MRSAAPGDTFTPWLRPGLEARPSPIAGLGLFTREPIRAGEVALRWGGTLFTRAELLEGKAKPDTAAIFAQGLYLADPLDAPPAEDYAVNHCCDPNLWMQDARTLAARRDILPGEELTVDYALWLYDVAWSLEPCRCGAAACRGRVSNEDWRLPELQRRYTGHFTPLINQMIAARISLSP